MLFPRRRSTLVIPKVRPEDAGLYRCEAKSVIGIDANITARVTVISDTRPENSKFTIRHSQFSSTVHYLPVGGRLRLKCDGTRAETRFNLSAKRTSLLKSAGASVQSTIGSRGVRISGSNAG